MDKEALHTSDVIDLVQLSLNPQGIKIIDHWIKPQCIDQGAKVINLVPKEKALREILIKLSGGR